MTDFFVKQSKFDASTAHIRFLLTFTPVFPNSDGIPMHLLPECLYVFFSSIIKIRKYPKRIILEKVKVESEKTNKLSAAIGTTKTFPVNQKSCVFR